MLMTFNDERLPVRFWNKVIPEPNSGCWMWLGATTSKGYGQIQWKVSDRWIRVGVHRLVVVVNGTDIPDGFTVDHRCEMTVCVRRDHLDVVTSAENSERYRSRHPWTTCPAGHLIADVGFYVLRSGSRRCKQCARERVARYRSNA